tara:strand:+ start:311 stop:844 length:534 start_codon:yes stop_codon:yes gene_type:complete
MTEEIKEQPALDQKIVDDVLSGGRSSAKDEKEEDLIVDQITKIVVLKDSTQLITGLQLMEVGEGDDKKTIGYYLHSPCVLITTRTDDGSIDASMFPWIPGSKDRIVPIPASQVTTIVEPLSNLVEMYVQNILVPSIKERERENSNSTGLIDSDNAGPPIYQPNLNNTEEQKGPNNLE